MHQLRQTCLAPQQTGQTPNESAFSPPGARLNRSDPPPTQHSTAAELCSYTDRTTFSWVWIQVRKWRLITRLTLHHLPSGTVFADDSLARIQNFARTLSFTVQLMVVFFSTASACPLCTSGLMMGGQFWQEHVWD